LSKTRYQKTERWWLLLKLPQTHTIYYYCHKSTNMRKSGRGGGERVVGTEMEERRKASHLLTDPLVQPVRYEGGGGATQMTYHHSSIL